MTVSAQSLGNFLADFYGKHDDTPAAVRDLVAWCASSDGQSHAAPAVRIANDNSSGGGAVAAATAADGTRFAAMLADYADWIMNTLVAPPGWTTPPGPKPDYDVTAWPQGSGETWISWRAVSRPPTSGFADSTAGGVHTSIRDWARTWCAAHPA